MTIEGTPTAPAEATPTAAAPPTPPVQAQPSEHQANLRMLMQREKATREAENRLKARENELREAEALQARLRSTAAQSGQESDPTTALQRQIQELQAAAAERDRREEAFRRESAVREAQHGARAWVQTADESKFPLLKGYQGSSDMLWNQIESHYQRTGELQSEAEAASEVEAKLSGLVEQLAKVEAVRKRFAPATAPNATPTISGLHVADGSDAKDLTSLSDDEAMAQALAILAASKG